MLNTLFHYVEPDPAGQMLGTRYQRFSAAGGIHGLMRENDTQLELLAVYSDDPGRGHFANFIRRCQAVYSIICVWPILEPMLAKFGFSREEGVDEFGFRIRGLRWDAPKTPQDEPGGRIEQSPEVLP